MKEEERRRCSALAELLGIDRKSGKEINKLIESSESFKDFRVRLIASRGADCDQFSAVVTIWSALVKKRRTQFSHNALMHAAELLRLKQEEIERTLREATREALDRLKAMDAFVSLQEKMRADLVEMTVLIEKVHQLVIYSPSTAEKGKKNDLT